MSESDRLRWRCRRGHLELDLLLLRFVDRVYPGLGAAEREEFLRLLGLEDGVLLDMLAGRRQAGRWSTLIERLRQC